MISDAHRTCIRTHGTLVGRILLGLLFFVTGLNILMGPNGVGGFGQMLGGMGIPLAVLAAWVIVLVKIVGGGALILGYRVGCAAGALIIFTLLTILFVHNNAAELIQALKNLAIIGGLLYVIAYGAGEGWKISK